VAKTTNKPWPQNLPAKPRPCIKPPPPSLDYADLSWTQAETLRNKEQAVASYVALV
jgi:hypothetical protein